MLSFFGIHDSVPEADIFVLQQKKNQNIWKIRICSEFVVVKEHYLTASVALSLPRLQWYRTQLSELQWAKTCQQRTHTWAGCHVETLKSVCKHSALNGPALCSHGNLAGNDWHVEILHRNFRSQATYGTDFFLVYVHYHSHWGFQLGDKISAVWAFLFNWQL